MDRRSAKYAKAAASVTAQSVAAGSALACAVPTQLVAKAMSESQKRRRRFVHISEALTLRVARSR